MSAADPDIFALTKGGNILPAINVVIPVTSRHPFLFALLAVLVVSGATGAAGTEAPVAAQSLQTLRAAYTFHPAENTGEPLQSPRVETDAENIIQLEKMIVMESPAGRGLVDAIDRQQVILKQAREYWIRTAHLSSVV